MPVCPATRKPHRIRLTHDLIVNYGLYSKLAVYRPEPATFEQMARFHSEEYLSFLRDISPATIGENIHRLGVTAARHSALRAARLLTRSLPSSEECARLTLTLTPTMTLTLRSHDRCL